MSNLVTFSLPEMERMARAIAASKLFGIQTPDQALALMLIAQAEGLHPAIAARDYHIIKGKPSLKADAMLARFQRAGGKVEWIEYSKERVAAKFSHPQSGEVEISWTLEDAKRANLTTEMWSKYPRQMLKSRVISEGVRTCYPDCTAGVYSEEEVADLQAIPAEGKTLPADGQTPKALEVKNVKLREPETAIETEGATLRGSEPAAPLAGPVESKEEPAKTEVPSKYIIPGTGPYRGRSPSELTEAELEQFYFEMQTLDQEKLAHPKVQELLRHLREEIMQRQK